MPAFRDPDALARFRRELEKRHIFVEQHRLLAGELETAAGVRFEITLELRQLLFELQQPQVNAAAEHQGDARERQEQPAGPANRPTDEGKNRGAGRHFLMKRSR